MLLRHQELVCDKEITKFVFNKWYERTVVLCLALTADSSNLPTDNMTVKLCEFENICQLALLIPIPDEEKKLT